MKKNLFKALLSIAILTLFLPGSSIAKKKDSPSWFLTPRIGTAFILSEVNSSFKTVESDFQHGKGLSADIALSRTFLSHFELGVNVGFYQISSSDDSLMITGLSAFGDPQRDFSGFKYYSTIPVEYNTTCFAPNLFLRYYFRKFPTRARDKQIFQPYLELSAGQNFYQTELIYTDVSKIEDPEPELPSVWIPREDVEDFEPPYKPKEKAIQYAVGIGSRFNLNGSFILNLSAEVSNVNTPYLDGTPNLISDQVKSVLVPKIMLGVAIPLGKSGDKTKSGDYLPWAH